MNRRLLLAVVSPLFACAVSARASAQCPSWDPIFGTSPATIDAKVEALAVFDGGSGPRLVAGGRFERAGGQPVAHVASWDGASWAPLGSGFAGGAPLPTTVSALAVFDDGTGPALYAGGNFTSAGGGPAAFIARWDGASWSALGAGLDFRVYALAVFDDGFGPALFVGGEFSLAGGAQANRIARWDGVSWSAVGSGMWYNPVYGLATFDDGSGPALYATGAFETAGGVTAPGIARWDGSAWSAVGTPDIDSYAYGIAVHDDGSGPALWINGAFTTVGGIAANHIAKWDGTSWSAAGGGLPFYGRAIAVHDDGGGAKLYAAGERIGSNGSTDLVQVWDGASWTPAGGAIGGFNENLSTYVTVEALAVFDDGTGEKLFAGGDFTTARDKAAQRLARLDGGAWSAIAPLGDAADQSIHCQIVFDDGSGPGLYAGGSFASIGAVAARGVGRYDGTSWSAVGNGLGAANNPVRTLAAFDHGSGPQLHGSVGPRVYRWTSATSAWSQVGSGAMTSSGSGSVFALVEHDEGAGAALYAGGSFFSVPPVTFGPNRIARWTGFTWTQVGAGANGPVTAACSFAGALVIGGSFTAPATHVAAWSSNTWSPLGSGIDGPVEELIVFDDGSGPALYAGGSFAQAGGIFAANVARWDGSSWSALAAGFPVAVAVLSVFDDGGGSALYAAGSAPGGTGPQTTIVQRWDGFNWTPVAYPSTEAAIATLRAFDGGAGPTLYAGFASTAQFQAPPNAPFNAAFRACVGPGIPFCFGDASSSCPCANPGAFGHGCENSAGTGGALVEASGTTQPDTLAFAISGELPSALSILLQGDLQQAPASFGQGLRCVAGNLLRLYAANASGGSLSLPGPGDLSVSARSAALGDPIAPGSTRWYQVFYRDPFPPGACPPASTWNVTNGVEIGW